MVYQWGVTMLNEHNKYFLPRITLCVMFLHKKSTKPSLPLLLAGFGRCSRCHGHIPCTGWFTQKFIWARDLGHPLLRACEGVLPTTEALLWWAAGPLAAGELQVSLQLCPATQDEIPPSSAERQGKTEAQVGWWRPHLPSLTRTLQHSQSILLWLYSRPTPLPIPLSVFDACRSCRMRQAYLCSLGSVVLGWQWWSSSH